MLNTGLVSVTFRDKTPEEIISTVKPVSYTHLDVYKRQILG